MLLYSRTDIFFSKYNELRIINLLHAEKYHSPYLFNRGEILTKLGHRVVSISLSELKNASNELTKLNKYLT
jgi:hypothetical protein